MPRFTGPNYEQNRKLVQALADFAAERGATPAQLAIAWVVSKGADIVPIIGARKRHQLAESLAALDLALPADTLANRKPWSGGAHRGTRYDAAQMNMLDSERKA